MVILKTYIRKKKEVLTRTKQDFASRQVAKCQDKYTVLTDEVLQEDWDKFCDEIGNLSESQSNNLAKLKSNFLREKESLKKQKAYEDSLIKVLSEAQKILDSSLLDKERITQQADFNKLNELVLSLSALSNVEGVKMSNVLETHSKGYC